MASDLLLRAADMLDECANELATALSAASSRVASEARTLAASLRASATARDATSAAPRRAQRGEDRSARDTVSEAERAIIAAAGAYAEAFYSEYTDEDRDVHYDRIENASFHLRHMARVRFMRLRTAREVKP